MEKDKATKERILESARREFLEKGYMKASLRTICKNAGVTTGALYFFFQDKEDLLRELVEEPLRGLTVRIRRHLLEEMEAGANFASTDPDSNDIQAAKEIVRFMYRYYDIFLILLSKSQGSRYENMVNYFADWGEAHYKEMQRRWRQDTAVRNRTGILSTGWRTCRSVHLHICLRTRRMWKKRLRI